MAQSTALKSHNLKVVSSILICRTFVTLEHIGDEKPEPTKSSTEYSQTKVLLRNAASTYKAPITSLMHHNGDSDNGAVGSA